MFECVRCGQCCKDVVFHLRERKTAIKHAGYEGIDPKIIARFRHSLEYHPAYKLSEREYYILKGKCPFFDREKGCLIYLSRPLNCRNFICGRKSGDEVLEWDGRVCLNQTRRVENDPEYEKYVNENLEKSRGYARSMGLSFENFRKATK